MFLTANKTIAPSPGYRLVKPFFAASRLAWFLLDASPIKHQQAKEGVTLLALCHFNQAALCHCNHCAINPNQAQTSYALCLVSLHRSLQRPHENRAQLKMSGPKAIQNIHKRKLLYVFLTRRSSIMSKKKRRKEMGIEGATREAGGILENFLLAE